MAKVRCGKCWKIDDESDGAVGAGCGLCARCARRFSSPGGRSNLETARLFADLAALNRLVRVQRWEADNRRIRSDAAYRERAVAQQGGATTSVIDGDGYVTIRPGQRAGETRKAGQARRLAERAAAEHAERLARQRSAQRSAQRRERRRLAYRATLARVGRYGIPPARIDHPAGQSPVIVWSVRDACLSS